MYMTFLTILADMQTATMFLWESCNIYFICITKSGWNTTYERYWKVQENIREDHQAVIVCVEEISALLSTAVVTVPLLTWLVRLRIHIHVSESLSFKEGGYLSQNHRKKTETTQFVQTALCRYQSLLTLTLRLSSTFSWLQNTVCLHCL
jgi:hypothetical protein